MFCKLSRAFCDGDRNLQTSRSPGGSRPSSTPRKRKGARQVHGTHQASRFREHNSVCSPLYLVVKPFR